MKKPTKRIIDVREDDVTVIQVEIEKSIIDFYQKETGRKRITAKGLSQFFSNLVQLYKNN